MPFRHIIWLGIRKKYPYIKPQLDNIARECDLTRVKAGIHYPSDGQFSKKLVDTFFSAIF